MNAFICSIAALANVKLYIKRSKPLDRECGQTNRTSSTFGQGVASHHLKKNTLNVPKSCTEITSMLFLFLHMQFLDLNKILFKLFISTADPNKCVK